jgi:hypothetical protein
VNRSAPFELTARSLTAEKSQKITGKTASLFCAVSKMMGLRGCDIYFVENDGVRVCLSCIHRHGGECRIARVTCETQRPQPRAFTALAANPGLQKPYPERIRSDLDCCRRAAGEVLSLSHQVNLEIGESRE